MRPDQQDELRDYLRAKLKALGWSVTVLATRSGVARSTLYNFLGGSTSASYSVVLRIANATGDDGDNMLALAGLDGGEGHGGMLDDREAAKRIIQMLAAIEDDDKRAETVALIEGILRQVAQGRRAVRRDRERGTQPSGSVGTRRSPASG